METRAKTRQHGRRLPVIALVMLFLSVLTACYQHEPTHPDGWAPASDEEIVDDSLSFNTSHHYTLNYNFIVVSHALLLIEQEPLEMMSGIPLDTLVVVKDDRLVVADIITLPADSIDSVWVQVARDEETIGWTRESRLLAATAPDNLISRTICFFSGRRSVTFPGCIVIGVSLLLIALLWHRHIHVVHLNDISSFYPALLTLLTASAAVLYASIQMFAPDLWRHYYFHPSLNPFSLPVAVGVLVAMAWAILVVAMAAVDDVRRRLPTGESFLYIVALTAVCLVGYLLFSALTLLYVGYPLIIAYAVFALWRYFTHSRSRYVCGNCGHQLHSKGICPYCKADNI